MTDLGTRDIITGGIVTMILGLTIYTTAAMTLNIAKRNQDAAINNAVSAALESGSALNCKDMDLIGAVTTLAENGAHLKGYKVKIELGNILESESW